jgi:flavin reductase (DIM6/NTAB) family NADH-FMN oxidoreductase RutF
LTAQPGAELRRTFGQFLTGVTVVTTLEEDGTPRGITANSFTSVSLDPPLILVCIAKSALSHGVFASCGGFAVSILSADQREVAALFASKRRDKFDQVATSPGLSGAPVLEHSLGWFDCKTHERLAAGDHLILIGRVRDFGMRKAPPLGFFGGRYLTRAWPQAGQGTIDAGLRPEADAFG